MPADISVSMTPGLLDILQGFGPRIEREVLGALDECAALVANDAKEGHPKVLPVSTAGTYRNIGRGAVGSAYDDTMRVSNPDGTLRWLTRTGVTRNSILPIRAKKTANGMESHVVSGMEHSTKLEYGSVTSRAFPFMRPALEKNRQEIMRRLRAAVRRGVEGS